MNASDPKTTTPNNPSQSSIEDDVLHFENHSKLTSEEVAKAIAHHNRRHGADAAQKTGAASGKKNK